MPHVAAATPDVAGDTITWSLKSGDDAALFDINTAGEVTFKANTTLDRSDKDVDNFTVIAHSGGLEAEHQVALTVTVKPIPEPNVLVGAGPGDDTRVGGTGDDLIQGAGGDDTITTGGGNDLLIGGHGDDTINLGVGVDTVLYRFESDANSAGEWKATDGADIVNNFQYGRDRLVMVDVSNDDPINNLAELASDSDRVKVDLHTGGTNGAFIHAVTFTFDLDGDQGGKELRINFDASDENYLLRWSNHQEFSFLGGVQSGTLNDAALLDDFIFDGMIDFITDDELPPLLAIQ